MGGMMSSDNKEGGEPPANLVGSECAHGKDEAGKCKDAPQEGGRRRRRKKSRKRKSRNKRKKSRSKRRKRKRSRRRR